jgi:hypothetical protein
MSVARRVLGWPSGRRGWLQRLLAYAEWLDRATYNGVLGTQRGVQPGAMLYMSPLGGGVSKARGNHGWCGGVRFD